MKALEDANIVLTAHILELEKVKDAAFTEGVCAGADVIDAKQNMAKISTLG